VHEQIGEHILWHLPLLGGVHADTIMTTWLVMVIALLLFGWIGASYGSKKAPAPVLRQLLSLVLIVAGAKLIFGSCG